MERYMGLVGLVALLAVAWAWSSRTGTAFRGGWCSGGSGFQFLFAVVVLKTRVGYEVFHGLDLAFNKLLGIRQRGGGLRVEELLQRQGGGTPLECFVVRVLPTIIFFSALMSRALSHRTSCNWWCGASPG